jgi:hypothetical protein
MNIRVYVHNTGTFYGTHTEQSFGGLYWNTLMEIFTELLQVYATDTYIQSIFYHR